MCSSCLQRIIEKQNRVVITDRMWARALSSTNQPSFLKPRVIGSKQEEELPAQLLDDSAADGDLVEKDVKC